MLVILFFKKQIMSDFIFRELEKNKTRWTREQEEQLASLYEQYKNEPGLL